MKKSFIITSMAAFAALCFSLTAQAQGPVVVSDKDDYSPGETAMFSAAGFQPGELLDFSVAISDDQGGWIPDIAWADIPADASGGSEVDYVVPQTWADKTLQLTVMGLSSGLIAQTTFTDSVTSVTVTAVNGVLVGSLPVVITSLPASLTVDFDYVTSPTGATTGDLDLLTTPSTISSSGVSLTPGTQSGSIMLTIPSGTTNQTANVKVTVHNSTGSGANNKNDNVNMAVTIAVPVATPTPTPSPSVTPSPTPCLNQPPVIMCLNNNADLGQVVGCLGVGTGFGQTFPVSYSVDGQDTTAATVKAHFTKPDSSVVDVDVASVTDPDGNTVHVTPSNGTDPVTLSGPGLVATTFSVDIDADDGQDCNNTSTNMCGGQASATIAYDFHGFFPPLSGQRNCKVKQGSAVPAKFQIFDCSGTPITPNNIPGGELPMIDVTYLSGAAPMGDPDVDDAGNSNGDTTYFRWDPTDMQWIFNLKTTNMYYIGNSYTIHAVLGDGTDNTATISIK